MSNLQFLNKFCKRLKDLRKILLKWLGKTVKYCLNFVNFHSCTEKWPKIGQLLSITLMKVYSIPRRFPRSETFSFNKILSHFILFVTKIFHFTKISQLPIWLVFTFSFETIWSERVNLMLTYHSKLECLSLSVTPTLI